MKTVLACLSIAALSVACSSSQDTTRPRQDPVDGQDTVRTPNDDESPPENDPNDQEGPTCNDPPAVTPAGWTTHDGDGYTFALPPGSVLNSEKGAAGRIWYLVADGGMGKKMGYVIVGPSFSSFEELEAAFEEHGPRGTFSHTTRECHDVLQLTSDQYGDIFQFVMVGGKVVEFTCAVDAAHADVCTQFSHAFHVK